MPKHIHTHLDPNTIICEYCNVQYSTSNVTHHIKSRNHLNTVMIFNLKKENESLKLDNLELHEELEDLKNTIGSIKKLVKTDEEKDEPMDLNYL